MNKKGILIHAIIQKLNSKIEQDNAELCKRNLYGSQKILHGADMFFKLAFMTEEQVQEIATACGL